VHEGGGAGRLRVHTLSSAIEGALAAIHDRDDDDAS